MSSMIQPLSRLIPGAAQSPAAVKRVNVPTEPQRSEDKSRARPLKPATDQYIPEEKQEPSGRYWLGRDEDGQPKIYFDDPERSAGAPVKQAEFPNAGSPDEDKEAAGPAKRASGKKAETCTGSTDKVDREIEKLKKKREKLKRQINAETDDTKRTELEKKLAQVESELRQKDNDTYRRQHTTFS